MNNSDADIQEQLRALRVSYADQLPEKLQEIETRWQTLNAGEWDPASAEVLHRLTHSLAGSGSTFGFPKLGEIARSIEQLLKIWLQETLIPNDEQRARVGNLLGNLHQAASIGITEVGHDRHIEIVEQNRAVNEERPLIYLIEDDASIARFAGCWEKTLSRCHWPARPPLS